ncbi:MAG: hypothetical protein GX610_06340 [Rhodococcus sp.]|nr:hypothetical protein [Rhodococcus sp. (in: high G+C Gram-positive bacteria)]
MLQRLSILLIHRVYPEVLSELQVLAGLSDLGKYTDAERAVLERMIELTNGLATGDKQFAHAVRAIDDSPEVRRLRHTLLALLARRAAAGWRNPQRAARLLWRSSWLMPGGLELAEWKARAR